MDTETDIKQVLQELKKGESAYVSGTVLELRELCGQIEGDYIVAPISMTMCKVTHIKSIALSDRASVLKALEDYKVGETALEVPPSYARVVVSSFNAKRGTKFKVTVRDGVAYVFLELEDRKHITHDEYDSLELKYHETLAVLRACIVDEPKGYDDDELM